MKCRHCAARAPRDAWFCPECRRSLAPSATDREPGRALRTVYWGLLLAAGAALGTGAHLALRPPTERQARALTALEPPVISVYTRTAPPPGSAGLGQPPGSAPAASPSPAPAPVASHGTAFPPEPNREYGRPGTTGTGSLTVLGGEGARTFVYLNGGKLLGEAPLLNTPVPAGRHTLLLWTPAYRARTTRAVLVPPGGSVTIRDESEPPRDSGG